MIDDELRRTVSDIIFAMGIAEGADTRRDLAQRDHYVQEAFTALREMNASTRALPAREPTKKARRQRKARMQGRRKP